MYDLNIFIYISYLVLHLTSILFKSHKKWRIEQTNLFNKLHHQTKQTIWFHCASFGEYQQIKPLITHYNKLGEEIIITFLTLIIFEISCISMPPIETPTNTGLFTFI